MRQPSSPQSGPPLTATRSTLRHWRTLFGEAWRFGIVGGANIVVNFIVFNALALTLFPNGELKANVVATAVATTSSYLMNRGWTFRHRKTTKIPREYVLFFLFNAAGLGIELAVMGAAKYGLGLTTLWALNLAKAAGLGLGTIFRFWTYRTFVFAGGGPESEASESTGSEPEPKGLAGARPRPEPEGLTGAPPRPRPEPENTAGAPARPEPANPVVVATSAPSTAAEVAVSSGTPEA